MKHEWDSKQYEKFENERNQPFFDLLDLIVPIQHPKILDLGCGNGFLTQEVHERLRASYTLGIDQSTEMLTKAQCLQTDTLEFEEQDMREYRSEEPFDLIISNAALQWVPNHQALLQQLTELLATGGQLAIQIPANQNYPTHQLAAELAEEVPYQQAFDPQATNAPLHHLLEMEEYAYLLNELGYESQLIRMQLYVHYLESTASLVEWVKGSLLTYYKSQLGPQLYPPFLKEYQKRLITHFGWSEPFFFPIKRLLIWAQLPVY